MRAPLRSVHFVLLHHGYRGKATDLEYLWEVSEKMLHSRTVNNVVNNEDVPPPPTPHRVFIPPQGSDGRSTDAGVLDCAHRFIDHVCATVSATMTKEFGIGDGQSCASVKATPAAADGATPATRCAMHFSAVGHSMGGLVLRATFPTLMERIENTYGAASQACEVHWEAFYTLASPHLGVRYMPSSLVTFLGRRVGHHIWTAVADLFCKNDVVPGYLVSHESLAAWARFTRRVLLNVVNDGSVLTYSSSFVVPVHVLERVGASFSPEEETHTEASSTNRVESDHPDTDRIVRHLNRLGFLCASSLEELRCNGVSVTEVSPDLWPLGVLPEERALAERILQCVGPLELHFVDFRPLCARLTSEAPTRKVCGDDRAPKPGLVTRNMMRLGANRFAHSALICQSPFKYPSVFGFVSEYIAEDLLGIPFN
ncbi:hypothetical protein JKF63_03671 [Porcisia hertigi]|uniref:DUF676 domain-containing protein n=1 Tax=Porcisia hertigi TaxID=2761500 RepID=A0A836ILQ0_9TRYP|nr:hypothetical protein JKF63_03671 [Porcisia hertigi]